MEVRRRNIYKLVHFTVKNIAHTFLYIVLMQVGKGNQRDWTVLNNTTEKY